MFTVLFEELGKFLTIANATMKDMNQFVLIVAFAVFIILFSAASCISRIVDTVMSSLNDRLEIKSIVKERETLEMSYLVLADDAYQKGNYDECRKLLSSCDANLRAIYMKESGGVGESDDVEHQSGKESVSE